MASSVLKSINSLEWKQYLIAARAPSSAKMTSSLHLGSDVLMGLPPCVNTFFVPPFGLQQPYVCACLFVGALLTLLMLWPHAAFWFPIWTPCPFQGLAPGHHGSMLCPVKMLSLLSLIQLLCLYLVRKNKGKERKPDVLCTSAKFIFVVSFLVRFLAILYFYLYCEHFKKYCHLIFSI